MNFDRTLKILVLLGAFGSFLWGVYQYSDATRARAEAQRLEASKPFLERQLALYSEATQVAARIATSDDDSVKIAAIERFWQLYWGELALVEDVGVEKAMSRFGIALELMELEGQLPELSLELAHACRKSLAKSWGVELWESHYSRSSQPESNGQVK